MRAPDSTRSSGMWVSVHDVMPSTLQATQRILEYLEKWGVKQVTLLVVPGKEWRDHELQTLHRLQIQGHKLAGHGWVHCVSKRKTLYHKLHGMLISRMAAEHLALNESEIVHLIQQCHQWFIRHDFQPPTLYVPPAWAMGALPQSYLRHLPFNQYEYLRGIYYVMENRFEPLPLLGFEADTWWRKAALRLSNAVHLRKACCALSLRIAIHPYDLDLLMRPDLDQLFSSL